MASVNKVILIGNLGRDPEVSYTPSGTAIAKLNIATTETWNDKTTGEKKENTEWHRVTLFGKLAELAGKYLSKGKQVYIEGKLKTTSYEKDGATRYSTDIIASSMQFLGGRIESENNKTQQQKPYPNGSGGYNNGQQQAQKPYYQPQDDDIQF